MLTCLQVIYIHKNIPGVLRRGEHGWKCPLSKECANVYPVNEVLSDHNVDKQMSDSRGEVAYYMADVSNVDTREIKEIYEALEELSCKFAKFQEFPVETLNVLPISSRTYKSLVLVAGHLKLLKALVSALLLFRGPCIHAPVGRRKAFNIVH